MQRIIFEMETSDPDDFMTLLWLADHPEIDLRAVLVTPGSRDQCQIVRWGLDRCGKTATPIGALHGASWWATADGQKARVSGVHYKAYGEGILRHDPGEVALGPELLARLLRDDPAATVLVGAAPKNIGKAFNTAPEIRLSRWVQQGGFAGDNLVANPLEKFKGRITCPSFNPGGAWKETLALLASPRVAERRFVSKNVCHGVVWTREMHADLRRILTADGRAIRAGVGLMIDALDRYLDDRGSGKAMHDLVAAACAFDERVCAFKEVEIYREKGEWGAREAEGTHTRISVGFDPARFVEVLAR